MKTKTVLCVKQKRLPMFPGLVTRVRWGAKPPVRFANLQTPVKIVVSTFTWGTVPCYSFGKCIKDLQHLQRLCTHSRKAPDIVYNFLIDANGEVYEGRGWEHSPGLPQKYKQHNDYSILIGFLGEYKFTPPNNVIFAARDKLVKYGVMNKYIKPEFLDIMMTSRW